MTPFMIFSQVNDSVIRLMKSEGVRMDLDLRPKQRQKRYWSAALFHQYGTTVLIPFIDVLRAHDEFAGKPAILLMANWSIHTRPGIVTTMRKYSVTGITFPPHKTQIFQILDLNSFGVSKRRMQDKLPFGSANRTVRFIQKVFHSLKQSLVEDNVRNAFRMFGFGFDITSTQDTPLLREEKLR
jgi:hypothetical protein